MKKRINLLTKKRIGKDTTFVSDKINFFGTIIGIFLFIIFLISTFFFFRTQTQISDLRAEKESLFDYINANKEEIAKMNYYSRKNAQLKNFLKDDAEFLPYYNLLKGAIATAGELSDNAKLDYMKIDKDKTTEFTVYFDSYDPAFQFLKSMETTLFLGNFKELKLVSFTLNESDISRRQGYELKFKGIFKIING